MDCVPKLNQARKKENEALLRIFKKAAGHGVLKAVRFETYLFTLLAVSYFCYSNRLTLTQTLDLELSGAEWERRLSEELTNAFSSGSGKAR